MSVLIQRWSYVEFYTTPDFVIMNENFFKIEMSQCIGNTQNNYVTVHLWKLPVLMWAMMVSFCDFCSQFTLTQNFELTPNSLN